jgi:uncharacterized protein (TIGR02271 family)
MDDDNLPTTRVEETAVEETVVPVIEEELVTGTRAVKSGSVRVRKEVEHLQKEVEMPLTRDVTKVSRIPINREIESIPEPREEGDTLIIPVVEEEIVVRKRLVLKEEIHIRRSRVKERVTKTVTLDREHAVVERLDEAGNVVQTAEREAHEARGRGMRRRKTVMEQGE